MEGYLGEKLVDISETSFSDYKKEDWALYYIQQYGGIDGDFHKDWVLDQVARILNGTNIEIKLAQWSNGHYEYRVHLKDPTDKYHQWVADVKNGEDGPETYDYSTGIAP